jgi:hypothetical protein
MNIYQALERKNLACREAVEVFFPEKKEQKTLP